jgi:hypothetical protein
MAHRTPPDLFDLLSGLGRERGGTENLVGHWVVAGMKITLLERYRNEPWQWGIRRILVQWRVSWVPQPGGTVPWTWSWKEGEGYAFSLGEGNGEVAAADRRLYRQWGRMSGALLFGIDPDFWEPEEAPGAEEAPAGEPAEEPGVEMPDNVPEEVPGTPEVLAALDVAPVIPEVEDISSDEEQSVIWESN